MATLALFDFDGTISKKDSLAHFSKFFLGRREYYKRLLLLSPMLLKYKLKLIPNDVAKQMLISNFFKGVDSTSFLKAAEKYSRIHLSNNLRPKAMERLKWHRDQGHTVVIVSASMESWLQFWCKENNFELVATKLEIEHNLITGNFATKNCHGMEKVNRISELFELSAYDKIYAYGNSKGDKEMLQLADQPYYRIF